MCPLPHTLQFLVVAVAGWINQQQRDVIDYLQAENRVLREQLGPRRLRFTDVQRRRLAAKAKALGRRALGGSVDHRHGDRAGRPRGAVVSADGRVAASSGPSAGDAVVQRNAMHTAEGE